MTIEEIYQKYSIPPNLARHQREVAAVGAFVCDHWVGERVDRESIVETLLLHDMGNIVKFKRPFLGELEANAAHWEMIQDQFIKTYGSDAYEATLMIVKELGKTDVLVLLEEMYAVSAEDRRAYSWEARICEYADCCVTPEGIVGFDRRIEDLKIRYNGGKETSVTHRLRENAKLVSSHVDENSDVRTMEYQRLDSNQ